MTPEELRQVRAHLYRLVCEHMDAYPNANPYAALRAAFNKHARQTSNPYAALEEHDLSDTEAP